MTEVLLNPPRLVVGFCRLKPVAQRKEHTVRVRGMETGISETSKRVFIFPCATQGGKQESFYFRQGNYVKT